MVFELGLKLFPLIFDTSKLPSPPEKVSSIFFWMTLLIFPIFKFLTTAFPPLSAKIPGRQLQTFDDKNTLCAQNTRLFANKIEFPTGASVSNFEL